MKISTLEQSSQYRTLKTLFPIKEKLCLSTLKGQIIIRKQDISFLEADNNYCTIHYNEKKLVCSQTLKILASRIHFTNFIRVHRSYVINFDKIQFINNTYTTIIMENGIKIPISRAHKQEVKSLMLLKFD